MQCHISVVTVQHVNYGFSKSFHPHLKISIFLSIYLSIYLSNTSTWTVKLIRNVRLSHPDRHYNWSPKVATGRHAKYPHHVFLSVQVTHRSSSEDPGSSHEDACTQRKWKTQSITLPCVVSGRHLQNISAGAPLLCKLLYMLITFTAWRKPDILSFSCWLPTKPGSHFICLLPASAAMSRNTPYINKLNTIIITKIK